MSETHTYYVIYKASRMPGIQNYSGPSWDNIDEPRVNQYNNLEDAKRVARKLAEVNPVGFCVSEVTVSFRDVE